MSYVSWFRRQKQNILNTEQLSGGKCRHLFQRRRLNKSLKPYLIKGGKHIANGTYKCVMDHESIIECVHNTKHQAKEGEVQLVMPQEEYDHENRVRRWLQDGGMPSQMIDELCIIIRPDAPHCQTPSGVYPRECVKEGDPGVRMVVTNMPRVRTLQQKLNPETIAQILDVVHALWQFHLADSAKQHECWRHTPLR